MNLFIILLFVLASVKCEVVEVENGKVKGILIKTRSGKSVHAFYKIPYAEPPVNELRFKDPKPAKNWIGTLNSTESGPCCYQTPTKVIKDVMSEDCLHLDVFTKSLTTLKPVIVWIHGGGFELKSKLNLSKFHMLLFHFSITNFDNRHFSFDGP